jgi:transposase
MVMEVMSMVAAFGELRDFLTYKAKCQGVPLKVINPENTSREYPKCQYIDARNKEEPIRMSLRWIY